MRRQPEQEDLRLIWQRRVRLTMNWENYFYPMAMFEKMLSTEMVYEFANISHYTCRSVGEHT